MGCGTGYFRAMPGLRTIKSRFFHLLSERSAMFSLGTRVKFLELSSKQIVSFDIPSKALKTDKPVMPRPYIPIFLSFCLCNLIMIFIHALCSNNIHFTQITQEFLLGSVKENLYKRILGSI